MEQYANFAHLVFFPVIHLSGSAFLIMFLYLSQSRVCESRNQPTEFTLYKNLMAH